jgi:hypothetical protein
MRRHFIFIILLISSLQGVDCQIFQDDYYNRKDSMTSEGSLYLNLQGSTWFYNNEYFNPYYKGYTLIGATFHPQLVYQSNPKLKFSAGLNIHRFYGDDLKTLVNPLFSIEYKPSGNFSVLMGSYNGGENHGLNDILFSFENHLTDIVENGILIRYNNSFIKSETWLNWESFILPGDTIQEQFVAGSSNRVKLMKISSWELSAPFCLMAHHAGGQINSSDAHVVTLINIAEGLKLNRNKPEGFVKNIFAEITVFHSLGDFIPSPGWAVSAKAGVQSTHFELNAEYFKADNFISFAGNPLYRTYTETGNPLIPHEYGGSNEMLNFKAGFKQKTGLNSMLFLRFEGYYFMGSSKLDYSYSLHFQVNDFVRLFSNSIP